MLPIADPQAEAVALRKESVDRNRVSEEELAQIKVALRKESVDRNERLNTQTEHGETSLSARRAWIEIYFRH